MNSLKEQQAPWEVAILIPCYNEQEAITAVVKKFRAILPHAKIFVYDNNSTDRTLELAAEAGAIVRSEPRQGKGNVVRRMFSDIEADIYILVDGDDTYDPSSAPIMIQKLLSENLDLVNGARVSINHAAYRPGHRLGNKMLTSLIGMIFGAEFKDILSGYKVFSRRFVKSFPVLSSGFEIETELAVHALELRIPVAEIETNYKERPPGSVSKLSTYRDGLRILKTIGNLVKEERPLQFFSLLFAVFVLSSIGLGVPIIVEFIHTGQVPRFPTAILATGLMLLAFLSLVCGLILDTVTLGRREIKRMYYLSIPGIYHPAKS